MLGMRGFTHVSLSVRDLERSHTWYREVLDLKTVVGPFERPGYREVILGLPNGTGLCLQAHSANPGGPFDERRTGLDHLAFAVSSREDLDAWLRRFDELGVDYDVEPEHEEFGWMVAFRDPDNIQLELHCMRR
jgi:glyoxylase I family protein